MNRNELIDPIVARLSADGDLLKAIGELTLDLDHCEIAEEQKPDTMYLLTGKLRVKSPSSEPQYHYHPIIKECYFDREATGNTMVCSTNLLDLQRMSKDLRVTQYVDTAFVAVKMDVFQKLQELLDEMVEAIMRNTRRAAECWMKNSEYAAEGSLAFTGVYETLLYELMCRSSSVLGAALTGESEIVEKINDISYISDDGLNGGALCSRDVSCGCGVRRHSCADFDEEGDDEHDEY